MILASLVIGEPGTAEGLDQRVLRHAADAVLIGHRGVHGGFQSRQGGAGVATGGTGQAVDRLVRKDRLEPSQPVFAIIDRPAHQFGDVRLLQRVQGQDPRARQQGPVDLERRVLRRRADEDDGAVLDGRQEGVLLGLVEAVDLVDEQDGAAVRLAAPAGLGDGLAQVLDP